MPGDEVGKGEVQKEVHSPAPKPAKVAFSPFEQATGSTEVHSSECVAAFFFVAALLFSVHS